MATYRSELGKLGEDKACEYLVDKGFKIIERNYGKPWGELDIIALSPDKILVFLEVKTMSADFKTGAGSKTPELARGFGGLEPEHQMTNAKIKKFKRTASLYAGSHPKLVKDDKGWRLDLIAIVVSETEPLTKNRKNFVIKYYENIV